jgi:hypothetical protein
MQSVCDRLRIFHTRASLSDDPTVKECLTQLSRQLLFLSTNANSVYDGKQRRRKGGTNPLSFFSLPLTSY